MRGLPRRPLPDLSPTAQRAPVQTSCPDPSDLLEHLFGDTSSPAAEAVAAHVRECAHCRRRAGMVSRSATALLRDATAPSDRATGCLTDEELAAAAESLARTEASSLTHLAECGRCRERFAAGQRVLRSGDVSAEVSRLESQVTPFRRRSARGYMTAAAMLAAAVLAGVMLRSDAAFGPRTAAEDLGGVHRENAITTTVAPEIVAPVDPAAATDSLIWTSVPHADRYRVTIFDHEGTLVWEAHTADTALVVPLPPGDAGARLYVWKVDARTALDRWVSSQWRELLVSPPPSRP